MTMRAQHLRGRLRGRLRWRSAITWLVACVLTCVFCWSLPADAQKRRGKRRRAKTMQGGQAPPRSLRPSSDAPSQAQGEVRDERGTKVKVIRFTGLDISGKLKSPQMLYFLNRMHAEFDRPRLPHRSFVGEIETSASKKPLR